MKEKQEYTKVCALCEYATHLCGNEERYLCAKAGVVASDHTCRSFSFDPLKRRPLPKPRMTTLSDVEELLK